MTTSGAYLAALVGYWENLTRSASTRLFPGVSAQVVAEAPCTVTVLRPRPD